MHKNAGFSLIELMIVVAIIAIIAAIALPSYNEHVRKTRRAAGGACITAMAQQMERLYTTSLRYDVVGAVLDTTACQDSALDFYTIGTSNLGTRTYTVTATPTGAHTDPACGALSINQAGTKLPTTAGCW